MAASAVHEMQAALNCADVQFLRELPGHAALAKPNSNAVGETQHRLLPQAIKPICYDEAMKKASPLIFVLLLCSLCAARPAGAQAVNGSLDFIARISPTAARPEPVRQFTFYVLTKSYADICKDVEAQDAPPSREKFIKKQHDQYFTALKKFIQTHPESMSGMELELSGVNPQAKWAQLQSEQKRRVLRVAPELAQTKYLAAQTDSDLDGHASVANLPAGQYWLSTLNLDAGAGDVRLKWDVPIAIQAGRDTRIELTNLNATDAHGSTP
jgi:hypothetical protein